MGHGWKRGSIGPTPYFQRTFAEPSVALGAILDAYAAVYGSVDDDKGWNIVTPALRPRTPWPEPWTGEEEPFDDGDLGPVRSASVRLEAHWQVSDAAGAAHVIEVAMPGSPGGNGRWFMCDGARYSLGGIFHRGPRVADFSVAGRPARLTMRIMIPRAGIRFRRAFGGSFNPKTILAFVLGAGVGGGVAAASAASTMLLWTIYTLTVDGIDQGSWVTRTVDGVAQACVRVPPGGSLPDGSTDSWPLE